MGTSPVYPKTILRQHFKYFVKYLLLEISPKINTKQKRWLLSKNFVTAFTPTNEAFGLMVLDNKLHMWNYQIPLKNIGQVISSSDTGIGNTTLIYIRKKQCGWKEIGLWYNTLLANLVKNEVREKIQEAYIEKKYFNKF